MIQFSFSKYRLIKFVLIFCNIFQVCLDVEASYPKIPAMNLKKVLETSLDASANVRLTSGRQCKGGVDISAKVLHI